MQEKGENVMELLWFVIGGWVGSLLFSIGVVGLFFLLKPWKVEEDK